MAQILLVSKDRAFLNNLEDALTAEGHVIRFHVDIPSALARIARQTPDLVLVDQPENHSDAFLAIEKVAEGYGLPVIVVSGAPSVAEETMLLRSGAEDYIARPCSIRVVSARVAAALRRLHRAEPLKDNKTTISHGALHLDRLRHEVHWNSELVPLTATEFNVLWIIAQHPGQVLSRSSILDLAYGDAAFVTDRSIDSQIKRIRRKLRAVAPEFTAIETMYGLGYRFSDSPEAVAA